MLALSSPLVPLFNGGRVSFLIATALVADVTGDGAPRPFSVFVRAHVCVRARARVCGLPLGFTNYLANIGVFGNL